MADLSSHDRPVDNANGALGGQQDQENRLDAEQTLADSDQTLADSDQTLADSDQSSAESDQASADRDQIAADHDQEASDRDLAHGVDADAHHASRAMRDHSARDRDHSAAARLTTADQRDAGAHGRDLAALVRDQAAATRDLVMAQHDRAYDHEGARPVTGAEIVLRAAEQRKRAASHRAQAAEHRALAAEDRAQALRDREEAARERLQALADREALAQQLTIAETDVLTGVRTRASGLLDLDHELDRCRRSGGLLVVAYVDIVGLKALNDTLGHAAGDALLQRVVARMRSNLRSYDLIIRIGGDEFLCAMSDMTLSEARERLALVAEELAESDEAGGIRSGLAELEPDEDAAQLIGRADAELVASRS